MPWRTYTIHVGCRFPAGSQYILVLLSFPASVTDGGMCLCRWAGVLSATERPFACAKRGVVVPQSSRTSGTLGVFRMIAVLQPLM